METNTRKDFVSMPKGNSFHASTFNLSWKDFSSWNRFVQMMYKPMDSNSIGVVRLLFGLMMTLDIPQERGLASADIKWGDVNECRFPLLDIMQPLSLDFMCIVYLLMWIGAAGIMFGIFFKFTCFLFTVTYWYVFLLDKTSWNNHSYLYGLLSILFLMSSANNSWSLDSYRKRVQSNSSVPLWNYAVLRFQIFILYFYAGIKKLDKDWLEGYSMANLSNHWVFILLRTCLTLEQIDYWIIHIAGLLLDITIGFWLLMDNTRPFAIIMCLIFHIINSQIFHIGMFPYVCIVTLPIFCHANWPKLMFCTKSATEIKCDFSGKIKRCKKNSTASRATLHSFRQDFMVGTIIIYMIIQITLPFSHFITKGFNNWTNGLYGYSWDMMVHSWDTINVAVKVLDHNKRKEYFLHPEAWVRNMRWSKHGDMMLQYAQCIQKKWQTKYKYMCQDDNSVNCNISIYFDVWCSLNGRFQQRLINPNVDITQIKWSVFSEVPWIMPLLTEFSTRRKEIKAIEEEVFKWSNSSDILFIADFPGMCMENYIPQDVSNVTLTILEGEVIVEKIQDDLKTDRYIAMKSGTSTTLNTDELHKVCTVSVTPSCYMYTYVNITLEKSYNSQYFNAYSKYSQNIQIYHNLNVFFKNLLTSLKLVERSIKNVLQSMM